MVKHGSGGCAVGPSAIEILEENRSDLLHLGPFVALEGVEDVVDLSCRGVSGEFSLPTTSCRACPATLGHIGSNRVQQVSDWTDDCLVHAI